LESGIRSVMLAAGRADWYCPLTGAEIRESLRMREILKRFIVLRD